MTSRDFCYWLQGYFEVSRNTSVDVQQTEAIKKHLAMVFKHEIDPSMPDPTGVLQQIHDGKQVLPVSIPKGPIYRC